MAYNCEYYFCFIFYIKKIFFILKDIFFVDVSNKGLPAKNQRRLYGLSPIFLMVPVSLKHVYVIGSRSMQSLFL